MRLSRLLGLVSLAVAEPFAAFGAVHVTPTGRLSRPEIPAAEFVAAGVAIENGRTFFCPALRLGGAGSCLVFEREEGLFSPWSFRQEVPNPTSTPWDEFGLAVALSGDEAIVGAPGFGPPLNAGGASILRRNFGGNENWGLQFVLQDPSPFAEEVFAGSMAIQGPTLVVGAPTINDSDMGRGSAFVFERDPVEPSGWRLVKELTPTGTPSFAHFGSAVAIHGDRIVVGAPRLDSYRGAAYVFEKDLGGSSNWGEARTLTAADGVAGDWFGVSVALSSDAIAVGARHHSNASVNGGAVYVYSPLTWEEQGKFEGGPQEGLGESIAFGDGLMAVGAPGLLGDMQIPGSVSLFESLPGGEWSFSTRLQAPGSATRDAFGQILSLDGPELVVGAPIEAAAYVYVVGGGSILEVPSLSRIGLILLATCLLLLAVAQISRRPVPPPG